MSDAAESEVLGDTDPSQESSAIWKQPFPDYLESPLPLPSKHSKQTRLKWHRLFKFLFYSLLVVPTVFIFVGESFSASITLAVVMLIVVILFPILVTSFSKISRNYLLRTSGDPRKLLLESEYAPSLLLRPFSFDTKVPGGSFDITPAPASIENMLAETCAKMGSSLIGLGRKDQVFSGEGAARFHVDDDMWKPGLLELLKRSGAVYVLVGDTPNLGWELDQIYCRDDLDQELFFVFPATKLMHAKYKEEHFNQIDSLGLWKKHMPSGLISRSQTDIVLFHKKRCLGVKQLPPVGAASYRLVEIISEYRQENKSD